MPRKLEPTDDARIARLSLPLLPSGGIDWSHLRPSTTEKVFQLIETDPAIQQRLEQRHASGDGDLPEMFGGITQENVAAGLDILSQTTALVFRIGAARFFKHPLLRGADGKQLPLLIEPDILNASFKLTDKQHEEMDPRAMKLAQRYSDHMPKWAKDNLDLIMLVSMWLKYSSQNVQAAMTRQIMRDASRMREALAQREAQGPRIRSDSDAVPTQPVNGREQPAEGQPLEPGRITFPEQNEPGQGRPAV